MVSSVIYNDTIELFKKHSPIINNFHDFNEICKLQTCVINPGDKGESELGKLEKSKTEKSYLNALSKYYTNKFNINSLRNKEIVDQEKEIFNKLSNKFNNNPDTNANTIEYIHNHLYNIQEIETYYSLAKQNKFDLTTKIYSWVKQMIKLINESKL